MQGFYGGTNYDDPVKWAPGVVSTHLIPWDIFSYHYRKIIARLLERSSVNVACLKDDPDVILGYSVWQDDIDDEKILHWLHVKGGWRNIGLGKSLIPANVKTITHLTKSGLGMRASMEKWDWQYNPFLIN